MSEHHELIYYAIGIVFSIGLFNTAGVAITKNASAAQRATVDSCRTLCIWIVAILQKTESFNIVEFLGFVILVFGTLTYNEILVLPWEPCNKNVRKESVSESSEMPDEAEITLIKNYSPAQSSKTSLNERSAQRQMLIEQHRSLVGELKLDKDDVFK